MNRSTLNERPLNFNLLCLPDEAISLIFYHLGASNTTGTFHGPKHAFALALTNKRLLCLFSAQLARIKPEILNSTPPTLSFPHMSSVIRLAGHSLRELHLPESCLEYVQALPRECPRLERLTMIDYANKDLYVPGFIEVLELPLRSLCVTDPSPRTMQALLSPPEELHLQFWSFDFVPEVIQILRQPLRKFGLEINAMYFGLQLNATDHHNLFASLHEACPRFEEVTMKTTSPWPIPDASFLEEAEEIFAIPRFNYESKCRKMILEGGGLELIRHAHPEANIEITRSGQTFVQHGDEVYVTRIPLWNQYLTQDVSRLEDVYVDMDVNPEWKNLLSGISLKQAWVVSPDCLSKVNMNVEVVKIRLSETFQGSWELVRGVSEVHLLESYDAICLNNPLRIIETITRLLLEFRGHSIWMDHTPDLRRRTWTSLVEKIKVIPAMECMRKALREFEARGGNAATVRSLLNRQEYL